MIQFFSLLSTFVMLTWAYKSDIGCRTHATILRQLEREGFHIDIHSLIELVVDVETASKWENCSLVLRENISSSFYVNPDQLSELNRSGVSEACTLDEVNIEAPQHLSKGHTVYVYGQLQRSQNLVFAHLNFPLHLRYHQPKANGGYSLAELNSPVLLINCPNVDCKNLVKSKAPCLLCGNQICTWTRLPFKTNDHNRTLPVPVGNLNHLWLVRPMTYILTFGGCLYVAFALLIASKE